MPITERVLRKVALSFPGAREEPSYGKPAFKIEKKFFTRLRGEDASIVWVVDSIDERDHLLEWIRRPISSPTTTRTIRACWCGFARLNEAMLRKMLERRWRAIAPKKLIRAVEEAAAKPAAKKLRAGAAAKTKR